MSVDRPSRSRAGPPLRTLRASDDFPAPRQRQPIIETRQHPPADRLFATISGVAGRTEQDILEVRAENAVSQRTAADVANGVLPGKLPAAGDPKTPKPQNPQNPENIFLIRIKFTFKKGIIKLTVMGTNACQCLKSDDKNNLPLGNKKEITKTKPVQLYGVLPIHNVQQEDIKEQEKHVVHIQAAFRGHKTRKKISEDKSQSKAGDNGITLQPILTTQIGYKILTTVPDFLNCIRQLKQN